jgi:hypothetical protein
MLVTLVLALVHAPVSYMPLLHTWPLVLLYFTLFVHMLILYTYSCPVAHHICYMPLLVTCLLRTYLPSPSYSVTYLLPSSLLHAPVTCLLLVHLFTCALVHLCIHHVSVTCLLRVHLCSCTYVTHLLHPFVLHPCYIPVTSLPVTSLLHPCYIHVTYMLHTCYIHVTYLLLVHHASVPYFPCSHVPTCTPS